MNIYIIASSVAAFCWFLMALKSFFICKHKELTFAYSMAMLGQITIVVSQMGK